MVCSADGGTHGNWLEISGREIPGKCRIIEQMVDSRSSRNSTSVLPSGCFQNSNVGRIRVKKHSSVSGGGGISSSVPSHNEDDEDDEDAAEDEDDEDDAADEESEEGEDVMEDCNDEDEEDGGSGIADI